MSDVLVLGNGISRLLHEDFIHGWNGELWACNRAYLEEDIAPKITLLTGHTDVLAEAAEYRDQHGLTFKILYGLLGQHGGDRPVTCPGEFRKDSGTTLIAQAHEDGFERIHVCGFDLGGPDIWSPGLEQQIKHIWVRRWRGLLGRYGTERIRFVGFDHMPFLQGKHGERVYMNRYRRGVPHIPDPGYIALHHLIYGGPARLKGDTIVRVEFIAGEKVGFVTEMNEDVAMKYVEKGKVKILEEVSTAEIEATGETEITADTEVTSKMTVETLHKIATMKGLEGFEGLKKAELIELLQE